MTEEGKKGVAFDVILKPASADTPPAIQHGSPVKERRLSQVDIDNELEEAEENRLAMLQAKQEKLKEHDRHAEEVRHKKLSQAQESPANNDAEN